MTGSRAAAFRVQRAITGKTHMQLQYQVLAAYLLGKRWFAAKGRKIAKIEIVARDIWNAAGGSWLLTVLQVHFTATEPQLYFLPLALAREHEVGDERLQALGCWILDKVRQRTHAGILYDAFGDERFCRALVQGIADNLTLPAAHGEIAFRTTHAVKNFTADIAAPVRHPGLEQSNTAVYFGNRLFLKGYRRLQIDRNPEVEVGQFLTEHSSFPNIVPVYGSIEYRGSDGRTMTLALLQAYIDNQGSGWNYVLDCAARFVLEHLADPAAEALPAGGSPHDLFLARMETLGIRTAQLHRVLCSTTGNPAFDPEPFPPEEVMAWLERLRREAAATLEQLALLRETYTGELHGACSRLLKLREELTDRIGHTLPLPLAVMKARYHGDYHLGQVLLVHNDFVITDFEGEPGRPLKERRLKHSPLRDVAGMLRSFSYAAAIAVNRCTMDLCTDRRVLASMAQTWETETGAAFLKGYRSTIAGCPCWPGDAETADRMIDLFLIEKALYELRYEMDNRPDWVAIPLHALLRELGQEFPRTT
ncbi:MAG: putative maltokinase [Gammaproteobacteria bacterium]|nr:putative maltokinase [Gammaproteobacteria bacterium]